MTSRDPADAYPLRHGLTRAERRVINAARKWRTVYTAWLKTDAARDMKANGENLALSKLLDALQALDRERSEPRGL